MLMWVNMVSLLIVPEYHKLAVSPIWVEFLEGIGGIAQAISIEFRQHVDNAVRSGFSPRDRTGHRCMRHAQPPQLAFMLRSASERRPGYRSSNPMRVAPNPRQSNSPYDRRVCGIPPASRQR